MTKKTTPSAPDRPTTKTPFGVVYTDTPEFATYDEVRRIRDWMAAFLADVEGLRIDAAEAVRRIDAFGPTLRPSDASLVKDGPLACMRSCLSGEVERPMSRPLVWLRSHLDSHWDYVVSCTGQNCPRPPTGQEVSYNGPLPRTPGEHTPAFGYFRAMASGRL